jgi:hypothetical protein
MMDFTYVVDLLINVFIFGTLQLKKSYKNWEDIQVQLIKQL